jgi:hypothetical protein
MLLLCPSIMYSGLTAAYIFAVYPAHIGPKWVSASRCFCPVLGVKDCFFFRLHHFSRVDWLLLDRVRISRGAWLVLWWAGKLPYPPP